MSRRAHLLTAALGAAAARAAWTGLRSRPPGGAPRWERTNHRGETLTLLEGPAAAVAMAVAAGAAVGVPPSARAAGAVAAVGAGAFGLLDDLGERGTAKGLRGHLRALSRGEVTTGGLKIVGIGVTGLAAAGLACRGRGPAGRVTTGPAGAGGAASLLLDAALVAGTANLFNLLDLRPGRCLKAGLVVTPALAAGGPAGGLAAAAVGPAIALLPEDLAERAMLGDAGANALGALLGTAAVVGGPRPVRAGLLAGVVALTLASEKVSFTKVIEATPVLRELDALGRRPR